MKAVLLVGCIIGLQAIEPPKQTMMRLDVNGKEVLQFSGTLYLPRKINLGQPSVNVFVAGQKYEYRTKFGQLELVNDEREVKVAFGDEIITNAPVKLYFGKEV